jgi:nanoRNase/pAp phosphatase (c-di-AMP/oligoRNAs hydrolase)
MRHRHTQLFDIARGQMLKYGGGGHEKVGTCQFSTADMNQKIPQLIDEIVNYHNYRS